MNVLLHGYWKSESNWAHLLPMLLTLLLFFVADFSHAQNPWQDATARAPKAGQELVPAPANFRTLQLNAEVMRTQLAKAPLAGQGSGSATVQIPAPSGEMETFNIREVKVVAKSVAALYDIKTYSGYKVGHPETTIRLDLGRHGFHAVVFEQGRTYMVEPRFKNDRSEYMSYFKKDGPTSGSFHCRADEFAQAQKQELQRSSMNAQLRTYRLALVASGEFSQQYGGSPVNTADVLASLATVTNIANGIYERDLAVSFTLVSDASVVFLDPATDPFDPLDFLNLLDQPQIECDNNIGSANYDLGHLLLHGSFGGAAYNAACNGTHKGRAFSSDSRTLTILTTDYFCHEAGHQLGGSHTFISQECGTSVANFRYETGEGSSIMAYAGVCGSGPSYQNQSDPFFHSASIDEINADISTFYTCHTNSTPGSGNAFDPSVNAQADLTIPMQTAFIMVGSATDSNDPSSQLTYIWEQMDNTGAETTGSPNCASTTDPLFRFKPPSANGNERFFPPFSDVLAGNNNSVTWEKLPCAARTLNFRLTARDNNLDWGRVGTDGAVVTVANTGPFNVTAPNGAESFTGGSSQNVTWTVNGTNAHCPNVDVLFSDDNGATWTALASNVTNNGSASVTIPNNTTAQGRMIVQCHTPTATFREASTFFDVSDAPFSVSMAFTGQDIALGKTVDIDSAGIGDTVTFTIRVYNIGQTPLTNVQVTDVLPSGLVFLDSTAAAGTSYNPGTGIWNIGNIAQTTDSLELQIRATLSAQGTFYNVAEVSSMTETDIDSSPSNTDYTEDDIGVACVRVPILICPVLLDTVRLTAGPGLTDYQWFNNGVPIAGATNQIYNATAVGKYTWTASMNTCPGGDCCPTEIEEVCYDLALRLTTLATDICAGDTVLFDLEIINQGDSVATGIQIRDFVNTAMFDAFNVTLNPAGNTTGDQALAYAWAASGVHGLATITGSFYSGDTLHLPIKLVAAASASGQLDTYAEVFVDDGRDKDSQPESEENDNNADTLTDNVIDNTGGDEDDHDIASVTVQPAPDLVAVDTSICAGADVDLAGRVTDLNATTGTTTFHLNLADAQAGANALGSSTVTPTSTTKYYVRKVTTTASCSDVDSLTVMPTEIVANLVQTCDDNGTAPIPGDDFFTIELTATNANPGASNMYEVYNGADLLATGTYGSSVALNYRDAANTLRFLADNSSTYSLTVRDADISTCDITVMTTAEPPCSVCPDPVCPPVLVTRTQFLDSN